MPSTSKKRSLVSLQSSWFSKTRKRLSSPYPTPSPSPPLRAATFTSTEEAQNEHNTSPSPESPVFSLTAPEIVPGDHSPGIPVIPPSKRRKSVGLREISAPKRFNPKDMRRSIANSQSICQKCSSFVSRTLVGPGWRIETKPRSPELCFTSTLPLYSEFLHSPLRTGRSFTIYYEGQIERTSEDTVCLALGYVAGKDRTLRMPGFEHGSIGIDCRDGRVYANGKHIRGLKTEPFEPRQRLGVGMTFSKRVGDISQVTSSSASLVMNSSINVELFLTRDGKEIGTWNLREVLGEHSSSFVGLEGLHDLYPAIGTLKDVVVEIWFDKKFWDYTARSV
jgi:hypothetical protein